MYEDAGLMKLNRFVFRIHLHSFDYIAGLWDKIYILMLHMYNVHFACLALSDSL